MAYNSVFNQDIPHAELKINKKAWEINQNNLKYSQNLLNDNSDNDNEDDETLAQIDYDNYLDALLYEQERTKHLLQCQMNAARVRLEILREDVQNREREIASRRLEVCSSQDRAINTGDIEQIYQEQRQLLFQIQLLSRDIDQIQVQKPTGRYRPPPLVPIPATTAATIIPSNVVISKPINQGAIHCKPPVKPPPAHLIRPKSTPEMGDVTWPCSYCTFVNCGIKTHCEQCNMPKGSKPVKV